MPIAVTAVLFLFWMVMSFRAFQRGDLLMAGVFALVGIVLSAYRVNVAQRIAKAAQAKSAQPDRG